MTESDVTSIHYLWSMAEQLSKFPIAALGPHIISVSALLDLWAAVPVTRSRFLVVDMDADAVRIEDSH